jgi:20S proteasome subunit beta 4
MTEAEALAMMEKGVEEIRRRLVVAPPKFVVKVVDADGVRTVKELKV